MKRREMKKRKKRKKKKKRRALVNTALEIGNLLRERR